MHKKSSEKVQIYDKHIYREKLYGRLNLSKKKRRKRKEPVIRVMFGRDREGLRTNVTRRIGGLDQAQCVRNGTRATGSEENQRRSISDTAAIIAANIIPVLERLLVLHYLFLFLKIFQCFNREKMEISFRRKGEEEGILRKGKGIYSEDIARELVTALVLVLSPRGGIFKGTDRCDVSIFKIINENIFF